MLTKTRPTKTATIGVRKAPAPDGRPGFIRIDSVHQGDLDGTKGLYHINAVDCVTQWQVVATVQTISQAHLLPVIRQMLEQFPTLIPTRPISSPSTPTPTSMCRAGSRSTTAARNTTAPPTSTFAPLAGRRWPNRAPLEKKIGFVMFTVDAETRMGRRRIPNEEIAEAAKANSDIMIAFDSIDPSGFIHRRGRE